jgi:stage III sporulation protein AC
MADSSIIFFLTGLAKAVTILHSFLKQAGRDEYAYLTLVVGLAIALLKVLPVIQQLFSQVQSSLIFTRRRAGS